MKTTKIHIDQTKDMKPSNIVHLDGIKYCFKSGLMHKDHFHLGPMSLKILANELVAILGPSGSGKTTLLRLIAGLETPKSGTIYIDNKPVFDGKNNVQPEKRQVGMMFQDHALFPHLNVRNNIILGIRHWPKDDRERRLYELEALLGLRDYLNRFPHEISGGQQQRVALARTLAPRPKVILLDEPLSNIDADLRSNLAQELKDVLKQTETTAIWVTHDQHEALDLADRILVLNEGKIEQVDTPWNLYNQPKTRFVADFVGHTVFIKGELKGETILTEVGTINYLPCLKNFSHLEVMVRPDDVTAKPHDAGIGKISKRQFFGSSQLYSIELPSGQHLLTTQSAKINWPIGTKVQVTLDIKSPVAFPL